MLTAIFMTYFTVPNQDIFHKETLALLLILCAPLPASALGCSWPGNAPVLVQGWLLASPYEKTSATISSYSANIISSSPCTLPSALGYLTLAAVCSYRAF